MFPDPAGGIPYPPSFPMADGLPIGVVMAFAGPMTTPFQDNSEVNQTGAWLRPGGWLLCDGTELNILEFPELYIVLGNIYGGDESQRTFKLPDYRGYFLRGDGRGTDVDKSLPDRYKVDGKKGDYDGVGSIEDYSVQHHTHVYDSIDSSKSIPFGVYMPGKDGKIFTNPKETGDAIEPGSLATNPPDGDVIATDETRPINMSVSYIIKACAASQTFQSH